VYLQYHDIKRAGVVELVDTPDLGSGDYHGLAGSSPAARTGGMAEWLKALVC
jgi:hypothetical protein